MGEERKREDRRVRRTKKSIRNAFAQLLAEKDINLITVQDIADYADINRKTFYNYYSGIYQVIDEVENELIRGYESKLAEVDFRRAFHKPYLVFEKLTELINEDVDFYSRLFSNKANTSLTAKIISLLKERTEAAIVQQLNVDKRLIDLCLDYTISGMVTVYQNWFNSAQSMTLEEVSETLAVLCFNGFYGLPRSGKTSRDKE